MLGGGLVSGVNQGMNQLLRIQPPELFFFFGKVLCFCVFVLKRWQMTFFVWLWGQLAHKTAVDQSDEEHGEGYGTCMIG